MISLWLDTFPVGEPVPLRDGARYDDIVIGAGLAGLCTAVMLATAGRSVAVLEARHRGAVTTGNTTAKLSLLHGTKLSELREHHPATLARAYVDANRDGQAWLLAFCRAHGVAVETRDAVSYAGSEQGADTIDAEVEACTEAGLPVVRAEDTELPLQSFGAVVLPDQYQFDPMDVVSALTTELLRLGGELHEGVTVTDVSAFGTRTVETDHGDLEAENVVLATGTPFLDRGLYFAKMLPKRSYALAFDVPGELPRSMYLSVDSPSRSVRTATVGGVTRLLVGGNGHEVGRHSSPRDLVTDLEEWTQSHFPGARRTHAWSAQDYSPHNHIPFVGRLPRGARHVYIATGFDKWGMSNAPAAALRISAEILDTEPPAWVRVLGRRMTVPADLVEGGLEGLTVAGEALRGWLAAELGALPADPPAPGEALVGRRGVAPVGVSNVDGRICAVSAVCPHLGGVVTWNNAESSWDCPLHGSRFAANGDRLEGPATRGLTRLEGGG